MSLVTLLAGIVLALLFTEITGILPGGIIVPAVLALSMDRPGRVLATLAAAVIALALYKALAAYFLLYGRRRFVLMLLLGALFGQLWLLIWPRLAPPAFDLRVVDLGHQALQANLRIIGRRQKTSQEGLLPKEIITRGQGGQCALDAAGQEIRKSLIPDPLGLMRVYAEHQQDR